MRHKLFLDTNIVLDLLGERVPFYDSIAKIATLADKGKIRLAISAMSYSTIFYVLSKYDKPKVVIEKLSKLKVFCETVGLTEKIIERGLLSNFRDFEDGLQYYSALNSNCNILITRNGKDFKESAIPIMTAEEYLKGLKYGR